MHVVDAWLWSLRRGVGTPCRPAVVTYVCKDDGRVCGGLGDRVRGQNMAFWQARAAAAAAALLLCSAQAKAVLVNPFHRTLALSAM